MRSEIFKYADAAKDEDRAAYAISCLTEMFVQTKRADEVFPMLPRLSADTPARYDLRLNVNLMQGGNQLKEANRFRRFVALCTDHDCGRLRTTTKKEHPARKSREIGSVLF